MNTSNPSTINAKIHQRLREKNVTQNDLAALLGVSAPSVNERLRKRKPIDSITFIKTAAKLTDTPLSYFIENLNDDKDIQLYPRKSKPMNSSLNKMLHRNNIKIKQIQRELGVCYSSIHERLSSDKEIDSLKFVSVISKLLNVPLYYFLSDDQNFKSA